MKWIKQIYLINGHNFTIIKCYYLIIKGKKMNNKRKARTKTSEWPKAKKFKHYWSLRMGHLRRAMQGVGNLSNTAVYEYSDNERKKTLDLVRKWKKEFVFNSFRLLSIIINR